MGTLTMKRLPATFLTVNKTAPGTETSVLLLTRDEELSRRIDHELGGSYELVPCESLAVLQEQKQLHKPRAVLVHMSESTLDGATPGFFMTELNETVEAMPMFALMSAECPPRLRTLADKAADLCMPMPLDFARLNASLTKDYALNDELGRMLAERPHKTLRGNRHSMVTFTPEMFKSVDDVEIAARYDVTVLLIGETGSGKTHMAQLIHERSQRRDQPFVTVACGAIPPNLIESELFGHVKGSFTGADRNKEGKFAAAGAGTLLLDEIDVLPLDQQAKLLRVLETSEYEQVGSNDTQVSQARLIVASNQELPLQVETGLFRSDLYYRLNVVKFQLLPLRERPWDVDYLATRFALDFSREHNIALLRPDPSFIKGLRSYSWPGNIRQLKNVVHRAVLYSRGGRLSVHDLPSMIDNPHADFLNSGLESLPTEPSHADVVPLSGSAQTLGEKMDIVERRIIEEALRRNNDSRKDTAAELGICRVTLYNKMKRFGLLF
jgi:DNA-binding NtrC family response regulator